MRGELEKIRGKIGAAIGADVFEAGALVVGVLGVGVCSGVSTVADAGVVGADATVVLTVGVVVAGVIVWGVDVAALVSTDADADTGMGVTAAGVTAVGAVDALSKVFNAGTTGAKGLEDLLGIRGLAAGFAAPLVSREDGKEGAGVAPPKPSPTLSSRSFPCPFS